MDNWRNVFVTFPKKKNESKQRENQACFSSGIFQTVFEHIYTVLFTNNFIPVPDFAF
jgi:hypothetical protein